MGTKSGILPEVDQDSKPLAGPRALVFLLSVSPPCPSALLASASWNSTGDSDLRGHRGHTATAQHSCCHSFLQQLGLNSAWKEHWGSSFNPDVCVSYLKTPTCVRAFWYLSLQTFPRKQPIPPLPPSLFWLASTLGVFSSLGKKKSCYEYYSTGSA